MNVVCPTYCVQLIQKLHEVFLELRDDLFTLKDEEEIISKTTSIN